MDVVKGQLKEKYTVECNTRDHTWIVDEPKSAEGLDLGPTPTELLLASMIGCKIITLKMYSERKGWDLKNISIKLAYGEKTETKTIINKSIVFEGELDEDQKKRLIDISGRCPVVKLVANSFDFNMVD